MTDASENTPMTITDKQITITWRCEGREEYSRVYCDIEKAKGFLRFVLLCSPWLYVNISPINTELNKYRQKIMVELNERIS